LLVTQNVGQIEVKQEAYFVAKKAERTTYITKFVFNLHVSLWFYLLNSSPMQCLTLNFATR